MYFSEKIRPAINYSTISVKIKKKIENYLLWQN